MEKEYVSLQEGKLLKELGFEEKCDRYYTKEDAPDGHIWVTPCVTPSNYNIFPFEISSPSVDQAWEWIKKEFTLEDVLKAIVKTKEDHENNNRRPE